MGRRSYAKVWMMFNEVLLRSIRECPGGLVFVILAFKKLKVSA